MSLGSQSGNVNERLLGNDIDVAATNIPSDKLKIFVQSITMSHNLLTILFSCSSFTFFSDKNSLYPSHSPRTDDGTPPNTTVRVFSLNVSSYSDVGNAIPSP
jgi:hypothetical protein